MKRLYPIILAFIIAACPSHAAEFIIPRAMGPVISRNDMLVQYEYYVDKSGKIQTYVALFDGKNTIRLSPAAAQAIAGRAATASVSGQREATFPFDQGQCLYQSADNRRTLTITPTNGGPVVLADADIDAFAKNCRDAEELASTWVRDALKIEPEIVPAEALAPAKPAEPETKEGAVVGAVRQYIPASVKPYVEKTEATIRDLYARDQVMTILAGVLGFLCLVLFFLNRRNKKNAYHIHEYAQEQLREFERRRETELADASGKVGDMARQLQRIQQGHDDSLQKIRNENAENAVIFADMIADMVRSRDRVPETVDHAAEDLAVKYGGTDSGHALEEARKAARDMVKTGRSAACTTGDDRYRKAAATFLTGVFDTRADRALSLVDQGRYAEGESLLDDAWKEINSYGRALFHTEVSPEYLTARKDELRALRVMREEHGDPA